MRILLIHQYFLEPDDPGGSRFNEMTKIWSANGAEVTVLAGMMHANARNKRAEYRGKLFKRKNDGNVEVLRCHVSESYNANFLGRLWGYFSFVFSSTIIGLVKTHGKYDLVLATSPPLFVGITAYILSRIKRIPLVFEVRDLWPESAIDTGVLRNGVLIKFSYAFENFIYRKSRLINVLTPAFRNTLIDIKNVPEEKIIFIPNAADFSLAEKIVQDFDCEKFREEHNLTGKFVITYVGAHGVANHLIQIVETAEILEEDSVLFQLIGDGMEKRNLMKEVKARGLDNIRFVNPVPKTEVFRYILASDLGASVLKRVDTFKTIYSNKTFDYMSCKKPILLCIDGVSRDLVEYANCGFYAEPENIKDIKAKIELAMSRKELLTEMGENGYRYAKAHFDRFKLASKYLSALEHIVEQ